MKTDYSLHRRELIGNLNKNKKLSEKTEAKMRERALTKKSIFFGSSFIEYEKKSKPIILYNLDYAVFGEYPSIVEAAKNINCSQKTIARALKTKCKILKRRFIVRYIKNRI